MNEAKWKQYWAEFSAALIARLEAGHRIYGDASFERSIAELCGEMEEEALDIIGWGFLEWVRIRKLRQQVEKLEDLIHATQPPL